MLSERQIRLLNAIILEYIHNAEPVGSSLIVEKYNIRYSPATVRNEMARLIEEGYLDMLHTSSGRVPTPLAYKLYLEQMMEEEELPVLQEVALKQRLWANRYAFDKMLRQAVLSLSDLIHELTIVTTDDGMVIHAGAVNLLDHKEFWDIDVAKEALHLIDRFELLDRLLRKVQHNSRSIQYLIGSDLDNENLSECGIVVTPYLVNKRHGFICVFGPARMNYPQIIPAVRYTKNLIEELGGSW